MTGADLEQHWQLDCIALSDGLLRLAERNATDLPELRDLQSGLRRCAYIYNLPETSRFRPCPDYSRAADRLQELVSAWSDAPASLADTLTDIHGRLSCR